MTVFDLDVQTTIRTAENARSALPFTGTRHGDLLFLGSRMPVVECLLAAAEWPSIHLLSDIGPILGGYSDTKRTPGSEPFTEISK
jgi:hypothetical protein